LLWSKNGPKFGIVTNEEVENFIDKYLTTDQSIFNRKNHNSQDINTNEHVEKKQQICQF
jgi:hypothetical protein